MCVAKLSQMLMIFSTVETVICLSEVENTVANHFLGGCPLALRLVTKVSFVKTYT